MTVTRKEIADGFKHQGADLAFIRHELQGQSMRLTKVEDGQRDMRAELRQVKDDLRGALERIEELERRYDSAPPAASRE
jgi:archaellum component FlaC